MTLRDAVEAALDWRSWPSWLVEGLGGLVLGATCVHAWALLPGGALAIAASYFYEHELDRNGWSWTDYWQRGGGILVGAALAALITRS